MLGQTMFKKITKEEFLRRVSSSNDNLGVNLHYLKDFDEQKVLAEFAIKNEHCRGGHIVVHDDLGLTQFVIYLWRNC